MGQARWRKANDPSYGRPPSSTCPPDSYPDYFPQELITKLEGHSDDVLSDLKVSQIYAHLKHLGHYCQLKVSKLDKEFYNIEPMRVAYGIHRSGRMGAFAYTSTGSPEQEKFDFININLGTPAILLSNFYKILSSPDSFVGYGDFASEDQERGYHFLSNIADPEKDFVTPLCPTRREYAVILTEVALDFVVMHEATHLYKGHVDWVKAHRNGESSAIDSFGEAVIAPSDLARQFFEVDADDCALQFAIATVIDLSENLREKIHKLPAQMRPAYNLAFGSKMHSMRTLLYSLYILLRGSDYEKWNNNINTGSHPRGLLRARYLFNRFLEITEHHGVGNDSTKHKEDFIDFCIAVIMEAEQDIARMEGEDANMQTFVDIVKSPLASSHIQEINRMGHVIEEETCHLVRGNLFPGTPKMASKKESNMNYRGIRPI